MKNYFLYLVCFIFCHQLSANDGAFTAIGNQLIPITESDITVQKEILTLKKTGNGFIEVTVYYEFFNPKADKTITVGFEAFSPSGDVDGAPVNGKHPYMKDFTVQLNGKTRPYNVAFVADSLYQQNGKINSINLSEFKGRTSGNEVDFFYVYHFDATFKQGINIIKHTYRYEISGGVCYNYDFGYILTAANRWGNNQIDDFTLIIDNGVFQSFDIPKTFFDNNSDWTIDGVGKKINAQSEEGIATTRFHIQNGPIIFQKKNFTPVENCRYIPCTVVCRMLITTPHLIFNQDDLQKNPKMTLKKGYLGIYHLPEEDMFLKIVNYKHTTKNWIGISLMSIIVLM